MSGSHKRPEELRRFAEATRRFVESLPSKEDRVELDSALADVADFISTARTRLSQLPSREDLFALRESIRSLEELLGLAEANPVLASTLGFTARPVKATRKPPTTDSDRRSAASLVERVETLTLEELRQELESMASTSAVRAVAESLGIRSTERLSRAVMTQQIVSRVGNARGYRHLSGEKHSNPQATKGSEPPADDNTVNGSG